MPRRSKSHIGFAIAILTLTACANSFTTSALRIGSDEISVDEFEQTVQQLADADQLELIDGRITGETTRSVLGALLRGQATAQLLAVHGQSVTEADRNLVLTQLEQDGQTSLLDPALKELIVELNSQDLALQRVAVPDTDDLAVMYSNRPAKLGAMCLRHILVATKSTAQKILNLLDDGEDFATLAGIYSIEPGATTTGGVLGDSNNECLALSQIQTQFDIGFTQGALQAKAGAAYGPVKSSFGWHIILIRPFAEISDSVTKLLATDPGHMLLTGHLATASISVKSSYGRWNPATGEIVAN
ncbi:MAG: peptidylprolyl isomerase [Ilumatobacteraceae bacterium]